MSFQKRGQERLRRSVSITRTQSVVLVSSLMVAACVPSGRLAREQAAYPVFDPAVFFAGRTEGRGDLRIVAHRHRPTLVEGTGAAEPDGGIVLDQEVRRGDAAPTRREWRLRRIGRGQYAGTLTGATGPVTGEVVGNRLTLAFAMKGGLSVRQWLYLQPGGRVAYNRLVVTKFGVPVASLDEVITHIAP